MIEFMF